ncbi:MAG: hypothetical protein AUJ12_06140 [Alphaproteobacteria bacterium CG1_02_46_17]|nr:MAG: hypothetical protein AUJ12_06140 [Alphaproteobacteria bacterium CG1_02_46_17]
MHIEENKPISVREANRQRQMLLAGEPRRRYSLDFKLKVLEEAAAPGASVAGIALRHRMNTNVIFRWRRMLRDGCLTGPSEQALLPAPSNFIPVHVMDEAPAQDDRVQIETGPRDAGDGAMEIVLPSGATIRAWADVDERALARVLGVVRDRA